MGLLASKNMAAVASAAEAELCRASSLTRQAQALPDHDSGAAWMADHPDGDQLHPDCFIEQEHWRRSNNGCSLRCGLSRDKPLARQSAALPSRVLSETNLTGKCRSGLEADTPWVLGVTRYRNQMVYPWVVGYKRHPIMPASWMYYDINCHRKEPEKLSNGCVLRRLWQIVPTMAGVHCPDFVLFNVVGVIQAYPARRQDFQSGTNCNIRKQLGVDEPYWMQLLIFVKRWSSPLISASWSTNEVVPACSPLRCRRR